MTPQQIKAHTQAVYTVLIRERRMREQVFPPGHPSRERKLREIDRAIEALKAIKGFADLHTEEPPEQVALLEPGSRRGGY